MSMTSSEADKVYEITHRLNKLHSPVLRLQAILQFSQIVDMLAIGDTSSGREHALFKDNEILEERIDIMRQTIRQYDPGYDPDYGFDDDVQGIGQTTEPPAADMK